VVGEAAGLATPPLADSASGASKRVVVIWCSVNTGLGSLSSQEQPGC
jgi:hypothetical protein